MDRMANSDQYSHRPTRLTEIQTELGRELYNTYSVNTPRVLKTKAFRSPDLFNRDAAIRS
jgi:hypothetical protein